MKSPKSILNESTNLKVTLKTGIFSQSTLDF